MTTKDGTGRGGGIDRLICLVPVVEREIRDFPVVWEERLVSTQGAVFGFSAGAYIMQLAGVRGTATHSPVAAVHAWLRSARKRVANAEARLP